MEDFISYLKGVFDAIGIKESFSVVDLRTEELPAWAVGIEPTGSFIVSISDIQYKERLERFLYTKIHVANDFIFWFGGEPLKANSSSLQNKLNEQSSKVSSKETEFVNTVSSYKKKSSTRLPSWIDALIFNELGAKWEADYHKFEHNIASSLQDNLIYLGTYFPRSYADSFCIFENLISHESFKDLYNNRTSLSILSVGCGTGGDIIGLTTVLLKYFNSIQTIDVFAIDGNKYSLDILGKIIERLKEKTKRTICLHTKVQVIDKFDQIDITDFGQSSFDYILTSKMIGEIISAGMGENDDAYYQFGQKFLPYLADNGLCLILDVTTKPSHSSLFYPEMMNAQLNQLLRDISGFNTILPIACAKFGPECVNTHCFLQNEFSVSHSHRSNDKCRIVYRIIGRDSLYDSIGKLLTEGQTTIDNKTACYHMIDVDEETTLSEIPQQNETKNTFQQEQITTLSELAKGVNDDTPKIGITIVGKIDLTKFEKPRKELSREKENIYIIDTNVFINEPSIISRIDKKYRVVLSAKVIDELDKLKITLDASGKSNVQKALKYINNHIGNGQLTMATANLELLPAEFSKKSPDNMIIAVALAYAGSNPIILTSDNGMQAKAKGLGITTISLSDFLKQSKIK